MKVSSVQSWREIIFFVEISMKTKIVLYKKRKNKSIEKTSEF